MADVAPMANTMSEDTGLIVISTMHVSLFYCLTVRVHWQLFNSSTKPSTSC